MDIFISLPAQTLELFDAGLLLQLYTVSTAKNGTGEQNGSYRTPRGRHIIRAKIGANCLENSVFVRRRPTGELWTPALADQFPGRDWMLSRILWLSGKEPGHNRLGTVDTMRRYIYLHGSPDTARMGEPGSIGCVRMRNRDIIELFDRVTPYTAVNIGDYRASSGAWAELGTMARPLRLEVFVQEQGVPLELEIDGLDASAHHALAHDASGKAIGTGRLKGDGHIGRMAVLPEWRGKGVGTELLRCLITAARAAGMHHLALSAQSHAVSFYSRFGFAPEGEEFLEAGIRHVRMSLAVPD